MKQATKVNVFYSDILSYRSLYSILSQADKHLSKNCPSYTSFIVKALKGFLGKINTSLLRSKGFYLSHCLGYVIISGCKGYDIWYHMGSVKMPFGL